MRVIAYTDGSCDNNAKLKVGGWASVLEGEVFQTVLNGYDKETSSARMELKAVEQTLAYLLSEYSFDIDLEIYSDAEYVCKAFNEGWIWLWVKKHWIGVKNADLWKSILLLLKDTKLTSFTITHVKGHAGNYQNEEADRIAGEARQEGLKVYQLL